MHTTHIGGSQSQGGSHLPHEKNTKSMQLEIDRLRMRLCHERCRATPSSSGPSSNDDSDISYRPRSRTPVSPFRVIRIIIIGGEGRVRLTKVRAMMLWAGL